MNMSVSSSSTELTMAQITRDKAAGITEMISNDIQKIGYNRESKTSQEIITAEGKKIQFQSNIDNSTDNSVETVTWVFTNSEVTTTENPHDNELKRIVKDASGNTVSESSIKLGVVKFNIAYYDEYGAKLKDSLNTPVGSTTVNNIKQLYISLKLESADKVFSTPNSSGHYVPAVWEKRFSPPNLEF
jgi:hypothetical protein